MKIRTLFLESWRAKLLSLLIAVSIWYLIKSHLDADQPSFPVPGTEAPVPTRTSTGPNLDSTLLNPIPPVPGNDGGN